MRILFRLPVAAACGDGKRQSDQTAQRLEARPQREGPVGLTVRTVERLGVIPLENRDVEEIHANPNAVAAQRIALKVEVVIVGLAQRNGLSLVPGESCVVEDETFYRRQTNWQRAEIESPNEWEPKLCVRDCDSAADELCRVTSR